MAGPRSLLAAEHNSNRVNVFNGGNMDPVFLCFKCVVVCFLPNEVL